VSAIFRPVSDSDHDGHDPELVADLTAKLTAARAGRERLDIQIARYEVALQALTGDTLPVLRQTSTAGVAIKAALASFTEPVHTSALLDHPDLVHYSRNTLRTALNELRRSGQVRAAARTPKGFIWEPPSA
jgi:hypothetical protein